MERVFNFNPGPAALPLPVLERVRSELLDYDGTGMSVLEMSHRSAAGAAIVARAEETLRSLLAIPDTYDVLFLSGGATLQFAAVPLNLMRRGKAGYVVSGHFSDQAWREAQKYGEAVMLATSEDTDYDRIPIVPEPLAQDLDYLHICQNNTIYGTMWTELPDTGSVPLVADVSSCFLSHPLDMARYGAIYAGAQKNAGPAGVTVVVVDHALIERGPAKATCPSYVNWLRQAEAHSAMNTPNLFGIYVCGLVLRWVESLGGLTAMERINRAKAAMLYEAIDSSSLFRGTADPSSRSIANVTFTTGISELDREFVEEAADAGLVGLGGHRLVGGMRASLYNAVPEEAVSALVELMHEFEEMHATTAPTH